jgi:tryptophan synthase alpha chain
MKNGGASASTINEGRIEKVFRELKLRKEKAFIPYIMAGDPSLEQTGELVEGLVRVGADLIELGVPFSDPIADGPVIQRAGVRSLQQKTTLPGILRFVAKLRGRVQIPLILMTYYNPIMKYGEGNFVSDAVASGVDGVIVPDLPPEEAKPLLEVADKKGLDLIFLLAPTTRPARMRRVVRHGRGFLYYVSLVGITGAKMGAAREIQSQLRLIRQASPLPIVIGFGISTPKEAAQAAALGDGVVVGSALVKEIEAHLEGGRAISRVLEVARSLKEGMQLLTVRRPGEMSSKVRAPGDMSRGE